MHYLAFKKHTSYHDLLILRLFLCRNYVIFGFFLLSKVSLLIHPLRIHISMLILMMKFLCLFDCCPSSQHVDDDLFVLFCLWFAFRRKNSIKIFTFYYRDREWEREGQNRLYIITTTSLIPFHSTTLHICEGPRAGEEKQKKVFSQIEK